VLQLLLAIAKIHTMMQAEAAARLDKKCTTIRHYDYFLVRLDLMKIRE